MCSSPAITTFFFFNDTATTEIYTLSLHDALPIFVGRVTATGKLRVLEAGGTVAEIPVAPVAEGLRYRSEEHTSELQSPDHLVCRLLLAKKKRVQTIAHSKSAKISVTSQVICQMVA